MRRKTFQVYLTRDDYQDADAEVWLKSTNPRFEGTFWRDARHRGPLRMFCYRRFVALTGIVLRRRQKKLVRFTSEVLDTWEG